MFRFILSALFLFSVNVFSAVRAQEFTVVAGFGVRNQSTHVSAPDWNRYFLMTNKGVIEGYAETSFSGKCSKLYLLLDMNSPRFFNKATVSYNVILSGGSPSICEAFRRVMASIAMGSSTSNQALIQVLVNDQNVTQKIVIRYENQTYTF